MPAIRPFRFLRQLLDVNTSGVGDGDALVYDEGTATWVPGAGGGGASALADLSDVTGGPAAAGEAPVWDGDSFELTNVATQSELDAHLNDTSAAHAASAISADSTTLVGVGTDVQAVLEELDNGIADHLADTTDAHAASAIGIADAGNYYTGTTVEAALQEAGASVGSLPATYQPKDADLTAIAALDSATAGMVASDGAGWIKKTYAQVKTALGLTTADVPDSIDRRYVTDAELVVIGNTSGTNTGDQTSVTGNAGTATKLATARAIDGQAFDGSADITVVAPGTHAASSKATPADADELALVDSAASNVLKKLTWANLKATLKTYFDTLYSATGAYAPGGTDVPIADGGTGASDAATARSNLGLAIGTDVQAHDADLTTIAGLTPTNDDLLQRKAGAWTNRTLAQLLSDLNLGALYQAKDTTLDTYAGIEPSANVQSVLSAADYAAIRTLLGLVIGTNVQAYDAELAALAGLTSAADKLPYFTGSGAAALADFTAAGRALVDDADASAQLTTLGVSTFIKTLLDDADAATARATLGVSGGLTLLYDFTITGSDQTAIDTAVDGAYAAAAFSGAYSVLVIYFLVQTDKASGVDNLQVVLNNDTGSNYDYQRFSGVNTTITTAASLGAANWQFQCHGAGSTSQYASACKIEIPAYADTTFYKSGTIFNSDIDGTASQCQAFTAAAGYRSTTAISRVKITAVAGQNLKVGSRLLIYAR